MRRLASVFILLFVSFLLFSCAEKRGQLVATPEGLEQALKEQITPDKLLGLSVREYPNDVFLVTADIEYLAEAPPPMSINGNAAPSPKAERKILKKSTAYIAQKGSQNGQPYWQITGASEKRMKTLGVKP